MSATEEPVEIADTYGWPFWLSLAVGWVLIAVGLRFFLDDAAGTRPVYSAVLSVGANLAHDAIFAPLVGVVAWAGAKVLPRAYHLAAAWTFFASVVVAFVAFVPIRQQYHRGDNPTVLPLNYWWSTTAVLGVVVLIGVALAVQVKLRGRVRRPRRAAE